MKYERYPTIYEKEDLSIFEFESLSSSGDLIRKRITFAKTEVNGVYNLAFGNIKENGLLDDEAISGDRDKVLATVVRAVDRYTTRYPRRWIYFCGSTPARTRLYRMVIGLNLKELAERFEIFAEILDYEEYVPFQKNMIIEGFLIRKKL
jgi:hypothetical protein